MNDAWADDPKIAFMDSNDPDSRALKKGLANLFWPKPTLLGLMWALIVVFDLGGLVDLAIFLTLVWLGAQILFRFTKFWAEVRWFFGKATAALASPFVGGVAWLNRNARGKRAAAPAAQIQPLAAMANAAAEPPPAPKPPRTRINWLGAADNLLKFAPWIIGLGLALFLVLKVIDIFDGRSGREVAAEARAGVAESETRTAEAEVIRGQESIVIVEEVGRARDRARTQTEEAREAVAAAPDLEAGFAEYRARALSLRDQGRAPVADAVRQHTTGDAP